MSAINRLQMTSAITLRSMKLAEEQIETSVVVPPDGGWGWVVVIAAFYCNFINDGGALTFGIFLETFVKEFNATKAQVSVSNSMYQGLYYIIGPVASGLSNRYGFRACTIIGALISGSGIFLTTLDFVTLRTMYMFHGFLGGIGAGFVYIPVTLTVGFYFERWRALATGIAISASGFGTVLFPIIISRLLESFNWRTTVRIIGGIQASCAIAALCFRPLKPQKVIAEPNKPTTYSLPSSVYLRSKTRIWCNRWFCCCNDCCGNCHSNKKFVTMKEALDPKRESTFLTIQPRMPTNSYESLMQSGFAYPQNSRGASKLSTLTYTGSYRGRTNEDEIESFGCWAHFQVIVIDKICFCCKRKNVEVSAPRPLYRDDIFFQSSLRRIPEYAAPLQQESKPTTSNLFKEMNNNEARNNYHRSVTRVATLKDVYYEQQRCRLCPQAVTRVITTMLDLNLLKSPSFLFLAIHSYITFSGAYVPFTFLTSRCLDHNLTTQEAAWQMSLVGISNAIGRIVYGILSSFPKISAIILFFVCLIICGLILIVNEFYDTKNMMLATAIIFGFSVASLGTLKTLVVFEIWGLENLTNAFGLMALFQGFGVICGVPLGGAIRDTTGSYFYTMIFAGSVLILGAMFLLPLNKLSKLEKQKKKKKAIS